ncbi:MAG: carboxylesterase family protein, partial [Butyrivibrio sp.]|nr:carboxylesterase family protein [Butyrivibrio sp.]
MILNTPLGDVYAQAVGKSDLDNSVYEIPSIPYAHAGRFERPVLVENYPSGKTINKEYTVCFPQHGYPLWMNRFLKHHMMRPEFLPLNDVQTEDAFVVNIWTDSLTEKKPVVVFIHGGGEGSGTVPIYTGGNLAKHGIVFVSITYRIGNFGYLPYFENGNMTSNLAYYDQQAALIWIRRNIGFFGGDQEDITLMGHCGGALSCMYQFLNPVSNRQFDKMILCAGNLPHITSVEQTKKLFED